MKIVRNLELGQWRRFILSHPQANVFHTPEMFDVFRQTQRHNPTIWAAVNNQDQPLALFLPVEITLVNGLFSRLTTRAVAYGSALCASSAEGPEALEALLEDYKKRIRKTVLFTELRNLSNLEPLQPVLQEQDFHYEEHLNYLIDLNPPPETIFQGISRRTRKRIRHGLNKGDVIIKEAKRIEQIDICYRLLRQTYKKARVPLPSRSLFVAAFDTLYSKGMIRFALAYVAETPVATSVELLYKDTIYGWYGGVDRAYSAYVPNELLTWHILQWGSENGFRLYDFGGAGKPDEHYGVRDFKAKFGGEKVSFGRNICIHKPFLMRLSQLGYRVYRRFL